MGLLRSRARCLSHVLPAGVPFTVAVYHLACALVLSMIARCHADGIHDIAMRVP